MQQHACVRVCVCVCVCGVCVCHTSACTAQLETPPFACACPDSMYLLLFRWTDGFDPRLAADNDEEEELEPTVLLQLSSSTLTRLNKWLKSTFQDTGLVMFLPYAPESVRVSFPFDSVATLFSVSGGRHMHQVPVLTQTQ
jgi:hypothetical protein